MDTNKTPRELDAALENMFFAPDKMYGASVPAPPYSTTGDGMLRVLEAMRKWGWQCSLSSRPEDFRARFYRWCGRKWREPKRDADTAPRAVALAALAALEQEAGS